MKSESPTGPYVDALGKPLLDKDLTTSKEYDPTVLVDNDVDGAAYIVFGHYRAYGGAGGKEKIGNVNFILIVALGNGIAILVDQLKIGDGMVFLYLQKGAVNQFGIDHIGLINRKSFLRFEGIVNQIDDNH